MAKIKDLPKEKRPREKLLEQGASSLSDSELLSIFLRVGIQGKSAIELGQELIKESGGLGQLSFLSAHQLSQLKGLGPAKASQLLATFELGERAAKQRISTQIIESPEQLYQLIHPIIGNQPKETLIIILANVNLKCIGIRQVSQGTHKQTLASISDILREVIISQADGFFIAHNHPSGDPTPSQADRDLTKALEAASELINVRFHDHIIVGKGYQNELGYFSFSEE